MALLHLDKARIPAASDFHVHMRDGPMSALVAPTIRQGGVTTAYVMPNLVPPVTSVAAAKAYQARLEAAAPGTRYLMTLYLHPSITPEVIVEAKKAGIMGVKSYPAGVTTNSAAGVVDYDAFDEVFRAMETEGLVLNLHGEVPGADPTNAEEEFLPILKRLHIRYPHLRIVLEHCSTAAALEAVRACGPNVVGTITAHHLALVAEDWHMDAFCYCKPVAKTEQDRDALLRAVVESHGKFFFGSDSAPHPADSKRGEAKVAGVFTQPHAVGYVLDALERGIERGVIEGKAITEEVLTGFLSSYGRNFYGLEPESKRIELRRDAERVEVLKADGLEVVPLRSGERLWGVQWID